MATAVTIRTEGDRIYLSGIKPLNWGTGEMCEFASALTRTLACVGEDVPYHYVMGVTGVAFRFTMGPELWNPGFYGFSGVSPDVQELFTTTGGGSFYGASAVVGPEGDQPPTETDLKIARELGQRVAEITKKLAN